MEKRGRGDAMGHSNILQKCGKARREGGLSWRAEKSSQNELDRSEHPQDCDSPRVTPWGHSPAQEHLPNQLFLLLNSAPVPGLVSLSLNISCTRIWAVVPHGASSGFVVP